MKIFRKEIFTKLITGFLILGFVSFGTLPAVAGLICSAKMKSKCCCCPGSEMGKAEEISKSCMCSIKQAMNSDEKPLVVIVTSSTSSIDLFASNTSFSYFEGRSKRTYSNTHQTDCLSGSNIYLLNSNLRI